MLPSAEAGRAACTAGSKSKERSFQASSISSTQLASLAWGLCRACFRRGASVLHAGSVLESAGLYKLPHGEPESLPGVSKLITGVRNERKGSGTNQKRQWQNYKVMFRRVCGFRVKGMGVLQNFQKFRVRVWKCYRTRSGYCGTGVQNSQKFWAGTKKVVPRVQYIVARGVQNSQKFRVRV